LIDTYPGRRRPSWRLGHQSSCDCYNTYKDDAELEHGGVAAIWLSTATNKMVATTQMPKT
jgi:hypothetical protein